jgi:hypothetical protein
MSDERKESQPMLLDCVRFEEALPELDRVGTPGVALREAALAHAESCGRCARLLTESESLDFALHSLSSQHAFRSAPPRVEAALLNRFRLQEGLAARRRMQWQLSLLGAAAVMLLVLGLSFHQRGQFPPRNGAGFASSARQPIADSSASAMNHSPADAASDDDLDAFIPLPYADDPDADGGTVVRVVLSRSALASLGLPDAALQASDQIPADLIVSQDGTPQAIRLVAQENQNQD